MHFRFLLKYFCNPATLCLCGAFILALLQLVPYLNTFPGLHADEAWVGLRAHEILQGARPMIGMNHYTGPFHQYLVAPFCYFFGYHVASLRVLTVIMALFSIPLYYAVIKRLFDPTLAALSTLTLATLPFFVTYGRIAHEVFALNPILALTAIWLLLKSGEDNRIRKRLLCPLLAGIFLGLGVWNHLIFIAVPVALLATAILTPGCTKSWWLPTHHACHFTYHASGITPSFSLFRNLNFNSVSYGFFLALLPRGLWSLTAADSGHTGFPQLDPHQFFQAFLRRLWEWPSLFLQIAHGDLLYMRFTGQVMFPIPNFLCPIFLIGTGLMLRRTILARNRSHCPETATLLFGLVHFLSTLLICPANADRYFLLPLYLVPLAVAYPFKCLFLSEADNPVCFSSTSLPPSPCRASFLRPSYRRTSFLMFALFILLQLGRTYFNYFIPQIQNQFVSATYALGSNFETSNHFAPVDSLYRQLVNFNAKHILAEYFIARSLQFYDLEEKKFIAVHCVDSERDLINALLTLSHSPSETYAIIYSGGLRRMTPFQYSSFKIVFSDFHFFILKNEPTTNY